MISTLGSRREEIMRAKKNKRESGRDLDRRENKFDMGAAALAVSSSLTGLILRGNISLHYPIGLYIALH